MANAKRKRKRGEEEDIDSQEGKGCHSHSSLGAMPNSGESVSKTLSLDVGPLPKLVIVDLDKTLWPFDCHEETMGPYNRLGDSSDEVSCRSLRGMNKVVRLFPEALDVLRCVKQQGSIRLAVASRSPIDTAARGILGTLGVLELFCCLQIYRGSKSEHAREIMAVTGVPYRDMIFFDDDQRNIKTVSGLGVCCIKVSKDSGLTFDAMRSGLKKYRQSCLSRSNLRAWLQPPQRSKLIKTDQN
ncbi:unnamed protein product [Ascophyllum nodosum]